MTFIRSLQSFFFARQTARGFGLMRIAWATVALAYFLMQWKDVDFFYGNDGLMSPGIAHILMRTNLHFTMLNYVTSPHAVFALYLLMLLCMLATAIGIFPRFMLIVSVLLLFSFDERDTMVLGGGDTLLRNIGFILAICPCVDVFSLKRLDAQHRNVEKTGELLAPATMSIWPYRLLLWQMIVLYGTSFWYKMLGTMWTSGTAVEAALHHPFFSRWPDVIVNLMVPLSHIVDWASLTWEGLWILLLVPRWLTDLLPPGIPRIPLKRILMILGIFFHGSIFILMDAGSFSLVMFTAYLGLLRDDDIAWFARVFPRIAALPSRAMHAMLGRQTQISSAS